MNKLSLCLLLTTISLYAEQPIAMQAPASSSKRVLQPGEYGTLKVTNKANASYFQMLTNNRNRVVIIPNEVNSATMLQSYYPVNFLSMDTSLPDFTVENVQESDLSDYDKQYMKTKEGMVANPESRYYRITTTKTAPGGIGVNKVTQVIKMYVPKGSNPGLKVAIAQGSIDIAQ